MSGHGTVGGRQRTRSLLIAGGGIAGLSTALALARRGIPSQVVERRMPGAEDGAGIQLGPNATRILADLGVADLLASDVGIPDLVRVRDGSTARVLAELPLGSWIALRHGAPYWVAHRADLHAALTAAARRQPLIAIDWGSQIEGAELDGPTIHLRRTGQPSHAADALVIADGLWSPLRTALIDPAIPAFSHRSAARTVIPAADAPRALRENATGVWLAKGLHAVHYPVRAGREIALVVIVVEPGTSREWSREIEPAWVADRTAGVHATLRALIAAAPQWRKWSLSTLRSPLTMARGPIALAGDAAHPVLPFLAQGGGMAIEDAATLASELAASPEDPRSAFARYESRRVARVVHVASASQRNGHVYHLSGAAALARNAAMRALGGERIMKGYDWLYGWRVA